MSDRYDEGMAVRREVLGDAHVDRASVDGASLDSAFQRWITESAWGGPWTRDAELDRRTRSIVTVTALVTLRAEAELALHLGAAQRNGVTAAELAEVIMHTAVYAGVPAANSAMATLKRVLAEGEAT